MRASEESFASGEVTWKVLAFFFFFALKMGGGQFHLAKSYREDLYPSDNNSPTEKRLLFAA